MRHFQAILLFLCLTIAYAKRVNLTVGLVAMTDRMSANPDYEVSSRAQHIGWLSIIVPRNNRETGSDTTEMNKNETNLHCFD